LAAQALPLAAAADEMTRPSAQLMQGRLFETRYFHGTLLHGRQTAPKETTQVGIFKKI